MNRKEIRDHKYKILFSTLFNDEPLKEIILNYFSNLPYEEDIDNEYTNNAQNKYIDKTIYKGLKSIIVDDDKKMMDDINDSIYEIELSLNDLMNNLTTIDEIIEKSLDKWHKERLAKTEFIILRLSIYEIYFMKLDIPLSVNEAVELAKVYGSDDKSYKFINGVLKTIIENNNIQLNETAINSN